MKKNDYVMIFNVALICILVLIALVIGRNIGYNAGVKQTVYYFEEHILDDCEWYDDIMKIQIPRSKVEINSTLPEIECECKLK